jgi:hypothetical protein
MNTENNPFKVPTARVADVSAASGSFIADGRRVPAGNGAAWVSRGWEMFKQAPGVWIGIAVAFMVLMIILGLIPFVNFIANLLVPVFIGGIMLGCKALEDGGELRFNHLFAGFSGYTGNLVLIGLLYLVGMVAIFAAATVLGAALGVGAAAAGGSDIGMMAGMAVVMLVAVVLMMPLAMAIWYAPALVVFHDVPAFQAMKASFMVSIKNFMPFLVYGLLFIVLAIIASIPIFLGWLVLVPVMYGSIYASYKDMFTSD